MPHEIEKLTELGIRQVNRRGEDWIDARENGLDRSHWSRQVRIDTGDDRVVVPR